MHIYLLREQKYWVLCGPKEEQEIVILRDMGVSHTCHNGYETSGREQEEARMTTNTSAHVLMQQSICVCSYMLMVLGGLYVAVSQPCLSGKHYRTVQLMTACTRLAVQFVGTLAGKGSDTAGPS
jgi:hypothetical protein